MTFPATQVKTFQPGQVRTTQITVLNTGNAATVYALEITAGETGVFGFASQRSPVLVLTPPVAPGQQRQIPVPVQLPDAPGPKAFRVRIGQAGPTGQIIQEFDEELFTGFAEVQLPAEIPLPTGTPWAARALRSVRPRWSKARRSAATCPSLALPQYPSRPG
jgi:hypothetical protein